MFRWLSLCCSSNSVLHQVVPTEDYYPAQLYNEISPEDNLNTFQYHDIQRVHSGSRLSYIDHRPSLSHHSEVPGIGEGFASLSSKSLQFSPTSTQFHENVIISLEKVIHQLVRDINVTLNGKTTQIPSNPTNLLIYTMTSRGSTNGSNSRLLGGGIESPRGPTATFERVIRSVLNLHPIRAPTEVGTFAWMCDSLEMMNTLTYDYPRRTSITPYITSDNMFLIMVSSIYFEREKIINVMTTIGFASKCSDGMVSEGDRLIHRWQWKRKVKPKTGHDIYYICIQYP
jgi:hypothetical protein